MQTTPTTKHILVIEDDTEICRLLKIYLENQKFKVSLCHHSNQAINKIKHLSPDLIILDIMLPGISGIDVCKLCRLFYLGPIIMLTACSDDVSELTSFEVGADDYIQKPMRPAILLAHMNALFRRTRSNSTALKDKLELRGLTINFLKKEVLINNSPINLAYSEYQLLDLLAQKQGNIVSRDECFRILKGYEYDGVDRSLDMKICALRKKLQDEIVPYKLIKTIRGAGYMLTGE